MTFDRIPGPARVAPRTPLPVVEEPQDDGFYDERQTRVDLRPRPAPVLPLPLTQEAAARYGVRVLARLSQTFARAGLATWASWADAGATCLAFDFDFPEVPA